MTPLRKLVELYATGRINRREVTRATGTRQRSVLRSFAASYGHREVKQLSAVDVERWIGERAPHLAPGSRRYEVATLRQFMQWLRRERHIRTDPMLNVKNPKVPRRVPRALSRDETARIWEALPDDRARAMFALMRGLGLRRCEVLAAQVGDWDQTVKTLHVTGKGGHQRVVPVPDVVAVHLARYLAGARITAGPMIRTLDGTRGISNCYVGVLVRQWMELAGVKTGAYDGKAAHSLRHTLASEVADVEPDLRVVQDLLGHVSLSSTQVYLRRTTIALLRSAMDNALKPADTTRRTRAATTIRRAPRSAAA